MSKTRTTKAPATGNAVAVRPVDAFKTELALRQDHFRAQLPAHVHVDKFIANVVTAVSNNPKLLDAHKGSLFKACAEASELGLSLNPLLKEADIIPRWNGRERRTEANLQIRYGGLMKLARNSGEVTAIEAHIAYEGDVFKYNYGLRPDLVHIPAHSNRGEPTHAYCVWHTKDGRVQFEVMLAEEIEDLKKRFAPTDSNGNLVGPWVKDEGEMWRKTVVRRASKYMPQSPESVTFQKAVSLDGMREGGEEPPVSIHEGEYTSFDDEPEDITEPPETKPTPQATKAMDTLEQKVANARQGTPAQAQNARPQTVEVAPKQTKEQPPQSLPVPRGKNGPDYQAWAAAAVEQMKGHTAEWRHRWREIHSDMLGELEFSQPTILETITQAVEG